MSAGLAGEPALEPLRMDPRRVGFFRFRRLGAKVLITNDFGRHCFLEEGEFRSFVSGELPEGELHSRLAREGFIRDRMDFEALAEVWRRRNRFLWQGPGLHVVVVTLRCDHRCLYCQASSVSMRDRSCDMSLETARLVVDRIFESPSPALTIEFQGGEPLANWPALSFIVDYARRKNRKAKRRLWINLVSNLSLMDEKKLEFLLKKGVNFCTSLDGPADLHDANRLHAGGGSHALAVRWWREIYRRTARRTFRIDALLTVTCFSLSRPREVVDSYLALGARGIYLRPLSPLGLARKTWERIGYSPEEFLDFYRQAFDYILEVNSKRVFFEQTARLFLAKMLTDEDPNFLDLRSPCGAGIGQIAYNYDGSLYTCDEGRMLSRMGDDSFRIGRASEGGYREAVSHPTVRALAVASCLDNQVSCSQCAYKPYCGICPIQCYAEQGDIMGRMPTNSRCRIHKGILDILFSRLQEDKARRIFQRWLKKKRPHSIYRRS